MTISETAPLEPDADPGLAHWRRIVERLPLTLQPSFNEQLSQWQMLFPFEQKQVEGFLRAADSLTPAELAKVTTQLRTIEAKMGVAHWNFSRNINSMENSGQLARSEYFRAWRSAVKEVFAEIESRRWSTEVETPMGNRLIVIVLPSCLPFDSATAWDLWQEQGRAITIEGDARLVFELFLDGNGSADIPNSQAVTSDGWLIDTGEKGAGASQTGEVNFSHRLNWNTLHGFREKFLADLNTIPRDTHTASETIKALRVQDWSAYWPPELTAQVRLKNFMVELFLSGNGSLIFSNAFVQWASSEALRRARPKLLIARFGVRTKPKPFTGIAIFENQEKVSTAPNVDDPENSAIDAGILARYVWLSALRYPEYERAVCVCVAERANAAWIVAPRGSELENAHGSFRPEALHRAFSDWLNSRDDSR